MTWPKEGSREIDEGIIVSVPMDWCKSTSCPVPYKIWARQKEAANLATSVHQTDDPSHAKESIILTCYGDEAGTGGGVLSGTHNAECTPKTWSQSVFFEGRNAVRHTDEWWMNHKNTWGNLDYKKDMAHYDPPLAEKINPKMELEKQVGSIPKGAENYMAFVAPVPAAPALLETAPAIIEGGSLAGPVGVGVAVVIVAGIAIAIYVGSRTSEKPDKCPCVVAPYSALRYVCGKACKDGQAHHIVPDYTKRYGNRIEGELGFKRIKGLANFQKGASICMKGNAKDDDTEHYEAHQADKDVANLGTNHPDTPTFPTGTARIGDIRRLTERQAIQARPECAALITAGVAAEFANVNSNTLGRTYFDSRFPPSTNTIPALSGKTVH